MAQRLPPMAVGDKTNRLYLNEKKVDTSRQSWRKQVQAGWWDIKKIWRGVI